MADVSVVGIIALIIAVVALIIAIIGAAKAFSIQMKQGPKGDPGQKGDTGPRGEKGQKGDPGQRGQKGDSYNDMNSESSDSYRFGGSRVVDKVSVNSSGSDESQEVFIKKAKSTNYIFNGYNTNRTHNDLFVRLSARNFNVGDTFAITNATKNIDLWLCPHGFSNLSYSPNEKSMKIPYGTTILAQVIVGNTNLERCIVLSSTPETKY